MTRLSVLQLAFLKALRAEELRSHMAPTACDVDSEDWLVAKRLEDRGLITLDSGKTQGGKWITARLTNTGRKKAMNERQSLVKKGKGLMLAYKARRACVLAGLEATCVNTWNQPSATF